ncbi:MAG TPA: hypothetical protein VG122_05985 [Gemmata sp.]|nr:hypothetical protein [Gemmata sp.]
MLSLQTPKHFLGVLAGQPFQFGHRSPSSRSLNYNVPAVSNNSSIVHGWPGKPAAIIGVLLSVLELA